MEGRFDAYGMYCNRSTFPAFFRSVRFVDYAWFVRDCLLVLVIALAKFIEGTENEPLSGVCFKVVDGSGAAVGPDDGIYYTDKAGEIVLEGIEPGTTVIAREIKTVEGFVLEPV